MSGRRSSDFGFEMSSTDALATPKIALRAIVDEAAALSGVE